MNINACNYKISGLLFDPTLLLMGNKSMQCNVIINLMVFMRTH